ncbi:MAG: hypothetical protein Q4D32_01965 [Eubacteriales bacterium]|nr:hypothetical protein [Eubacteriales bacterium]
MVTKVLLIAVAVIILGIAVFSWRFENMGDDSLEENTVKDADKAKE